MKSLSEKQHKSLTNHFQQGQKAIQQGLLDQAEKHFLAVLKLKSNLPEARAALAYVYSASTQHSKATSELKTLLKLNPNHAQTHHNLANSLYAQDLYEESISHYSAALKTNPRMVESHIHCGIAYRMLKKHEQAIACLHRALDLDKKNTRAFYVLGMIYDDIEDFGRALHCLESAVGLSPKDAEYRVSFAGTLEKAQLDFEAGIELHKACEIDPSYLDSFTLYAEYLLKNHRHNEALECLLHAKQLAPENLDLFDLLGKIYTGMNDTETATAQYEMALKKEPNRRSSLLGLAEVYQQSGDSAKGVEMCNKIIAIDASLPEGYLIKARMKKAMLDDNLADPLRKLTTQEGIGEENKYLSFFALGKVYDDVKNYTEAFNAYSAGNAIKNKGLSYSKESFEALISSLIEVFNRDTLQDKQHLASESNLPVLIVGMPRSGTTLTEQIISSHPKVLGAGEVMFWGKAPTALALRIGTETTYPQCASEMTKEHAEGIASMYEETLRNIVGPKTNPEHITDKMPHNFLHVGLIAMLFPNVKIIHTKRNPVDTCLSIFFQNFNKAHPYASDLTTIAHQYKQYEHIMQHWHEVLPGRILDINYEDTISDPEFWSRKLIDYIDLEWDDACLAPHKLERSVKTASHWQVRQPIYKSSVQRWKNYETFLEPLITALKS